MADPKPFDAWQIDGAHYFVFALKAEDGDGPAQNPMALFVMGADIGGLTSAVVVTPALETGHVVVQDLRNPGAPVNVNLNDQ